MGLIALLVALMTGAIGAIVLSVLPFAVLLTSVFVVGGAVAVALVPSTSEAIESALALFAAAQVGYGLGLAARARL